MNKFYHPIFRSVSSFFLWVLALFLIALSPLLLWLLDLFDPIHRKIQDDESQHEKENAIRIVEK